MLTQEVPGFNITSPDFISRNHPGSAYPPRYSCFWTISADSNLQIVLKVLSIRLRTRQGDTIQLGNGHDPSIPSTQIAILEGKDDDNILGKSYLSSGSMMWITKVTARNNVYANWAAFKLEITRYNSSGRCFITLYSMYTLTNYTDDNIS